MNLFNKGIPGTWHSPEKNNLIYTSLFNNINNNIYLKVIVFTMCALDL